MPFSPFKSSRLSLLGIGLTLFTAHVLADESKAPSHDHGCAPTGTHSETFRLDGLVQRKKTFSADSLRAYPSSKVNVWYSTGKGPVETSFIGVPLFDLLEEAGVKLDPERKNDILRKYLVIRASDCYESVISMAELLPNVAGQQVLVAYGHGDGTALDPQDGMARLVVPGDKAGGRYVSNISRIEVRSAPDDH